MSITEEARKDGSETGWASGPQRIESVTNLSQKEIEAKK